MANKKYIVRRHTIEIESGPTYDAHWVWVNFKQFGETLHGFDMPKEVFEKVFMEEPPEQDIDT